MMERPKVLILDSQVQAIKDNDPVILPKYCLLDLTSGGYDIHVTRNIRLTEMAVPMWSSVDPGALCFNPMPYIVAQNIRDEANIQTREAFVEGGEDVKGEVKIQITSGYRSWGKHMDLYRCRSREAPRESHHLSLPGGRVWSAFDFKLIGFAPKRGVVYDIIESVLEFHGIHGGVYYIGKGCWHVDLRKKRWRGAL